MSAPYLIMSHFRPGGKRTNSSERIIFVWTLFYRVRVRLWDLETNSFYAGKKWKSLTPSERAPCVQEAEKLRLKHMQVRKKRENKAWLRKLADIRRSERNQAKLEVQLSVTDISICSSHLSPSRKYWNCNLELSGPHQNWVAEWALSRRFVLQRQCLFCASVLEKLQLFSTSGLKTQIKVIINI